MQQETSRMIEQERFLSGKVAQCRYQRPWSLATALASILSLVPTSFSSTGNNGKHARRHRRRVYQCRKTLIRRLVSSLPRDGDGPVLWPGPGREKEALEMAHSGSISQRRAPQSLVQEDNLVSTATETGTLGGLAAVTELVGPASVKPDMTEATDNETEVQQDVIDNVQRQIDWIISTNELSTSKSYVDSGKQSKDGTLEGGLQRQHGDSTKENDQWPELSKAQQMAAAAAALENILDNLTLNAVPHGH